MKKISLPLDVVEGHLLDFLRECDGDTFASIVDHVFGTSSTYDEDKEIFTLEVTEDYCNEFEEHGLVQEEEEIPENGLISIGGVPLTEAQREFVERAVEEEFEIDFAYSGRGMYGKTCPAIKVENLEDFSHTEEYYYESLGMRYVIYCR